MHKNITTHTQRTFVVAALLLATVLSFNSGARAPLLHADLDGDGRRFLTTTVTQI